jgi:hypothetical protein
MMSCILAAEKRTVLLITGLFSMQALTNLYEFGKKNRRIRIVAYKQMRGLVNERQRPRFSLN